MNKTIAFTRGENKAVIYGRIIGSFTTDPASKHPKNWEWYNTITASTTFTVPNDMWLRLYVIGSGGNGKSGYYGSSEDTDDDGSSDVYYTGAGGGGGGSPGVSVHAAYFKMGDTIKIEKTNNRTSGQTCTQGKVTVTFGETVITATNGADAVNRSGGAGGTAIGGNIYNYIGRTGSQGGSGEEDTRPCYGGDGGRGGEKASEDIPYLGSPGSGGEGYVNTSTSTRVPREGREGQSISSGADTKLGGAGGGGGGGSGRNSYEPGAGGRGVTGGVVFEKALDA